MYKNYLSGLSKVAHKILAVPGYYEKNKKLLEGDKGYNEFLEDFTLRLEGSSLSLVAKDILIEKLSGLKLSSYSDDLNDFAIVFFGGSPNNLKQFNWFLEKLNKKSLNLTHTNLSFIKAKKSKNKLELDSEFLTGVIDSYQGFLADLDNPSIYLTYQLHRYTIAYINFSFNLLNSQFKIAVVANDHSPIHVAYIEVARKMGKKTIYIQHAEVNESFPPLNFDLSILNNQVSLDYYKKSGEVSGEVLLVSRFKEVFDYNKISKKNSGDVNIVLYLTSSINFPGLNNVIDTIKSNKYVNSIYLKPHTRTKPSEIRAGLDGKEVEIIEEIPSFDHIAVVANSSVVIELMNNSIKCFHNFSMDYIVEDTYGFCKNGLVPHISDNDLRDKFWDSYEFSQNRLNLLAGYIPYISEGYIANDVDENLRDIVNSFIKVKDKDISILNENSNEPLNIRFCRYVAVNFPITFLNAFNSYDGKHEECSWLDDLVALKIVKSLFNERHLNMNVFFKYSSNMPIQSSLVCWLQLTLSEWPGNNIEEEKLKEIINFVVSYNGHKVFGNELESKLVLALIRENKVNEMRFLLGNIKYATIRTRNSKFKAAFVLFCKKNKLVDDDYFHKYYKDCFEGLEGFENLRFKIYSFDANYDDESLFDHQSIVEEFLEYSNENVRAEFKNFILPAYDLLSEKMSLMDVRFKKEQRDLFFNLVVKSLKDKRPFSMIRLSDGEGYIFHREKGPFTIEDAINRERHWWGCKLSEKDRTDLALDMREAVENVDVLGIPSVYRFLRDIGFKTKSLMDGLTIRGMLQILGAIKNLKLDNTLISEELCNQSLFKDLSVLKELFSNSNRVVFINSLESEELKKKFTSINFIHIKIPTHSRQGNNTKYHMGDKPLPYIYKEIREEIRNKVAPGDLVLVSGGIIGKIFISDAKLAGAVALDMGSALDNMFYFN